MKVRFHVVMMTLAVTLMVVNFAALGVQRGNQRIGHLSAELRYRTEVSRPIDFNDNTVCSNPQTTYVEKGGLKYVFVDCVSYGTQVIHRATDQQGVVLEPSIIEHNTQSTDGNWYRTVVK